MRSLLTSILATGALLLVSLPSLADWDAGVAAYSSGNYSAAAQEFQTLVDQRSDCGVCYQMLGQSLLKLSRPQDAVNQLRKAYDLDPQNDGIRMPLARAYLEAKRYDDAVQLLRTMNPESLTKPLPN